MKIEKGSYYTIAKLPGSISGGVSVGDRVQAISEVEKIGYTSKVRLKFLDRSGEITLDDYCLQPLTKKEAAEIDALEQVAENIEILYRDPRKLKLHPKNSEIYGDSESIEDLIETIERTGEIHPLIINQDSEIISGHRRRRAAIKLNWKLVPVQIKVFHNKTKELKALLSYNGFRDKTIEQKTNEANTWREIFEQEREKEPQKKTKKRERIRDLAAEKAGLSPSTYHRSNTVLEKVKEFEEKGDLETANKLKEKVNKSPTAAYEECQKIKKQAEGFKYPVGEICQVSADSNSELKKYKGLWGVVVAKNDILGDFMVYDRIIENVNSCYLKSLKFNELDCKKARKIMERLNAIGSKLDRESVDIDILQGISRRPKAELTLKEHQILRTLETFESNWKLA